MNARGQRDSGRFHPDVVNGWRLSPDDFTRRGLPSEHGIGTRVTSDGHQWWAWRQTVSGWVLALRSCPRAPTSSIYQYAGPVVPIGVPTDSAVWGAAWDTPPDWSSLDG